MKRKSGSGLSWIVFSVIVVVIPVLFAILISCIINSKPLQLDEILDSIILIVFSIACSLLSICYQVYKQKSDKLVKVVLGISISIMVIAWTFYIISLVKALNNLAKEISILSCLVIIILSCLGITMGKKSDKNENETIKVMHDNCGEIRKSLLSRQCNDHLKPFTIHENDLLCNPDEFDRVKETLINI